MKSKAELRPGFLTDPEWLRTVNCCPAGLYGYAVLRKPLGSDCVRLNIKVVADQFDVRHATAHAWLEQLEGWNLTWRHPVRYAVCLHFHKAGDYRGGVWVPVEATHLEFHTPSITEIRNPVCPDTSTEIRNPEAGRITVSPREDYVKAYSSILQRKRRSRLKGPSPVFSPIKSSPGAAAPRTPDGARVGALTAAEREEFSRDVDSLPDPLRRVFTKIRDRIAPSGAPSSATAGLRLEDSADEA